MSDLNFDVTINSNPAIQSLNRIQDKVQTLESKFSGFASAIAAIGIGAAISNTIRYADALQDLADSTNIATSDLLEFQKAVELSGGTSESAQQSVSKLTLSIDEAARGGKNVQQAFNEVGVSLNDLRNLSEKDILQKTVEGLSKITDAGKRATLAQDLLGKSARNLNYSNLSQQFGQTSLESIKAAENFKKLADFQDKLSATTQKLRESLAAALGPLVDKINQIPQDTLNRLIESFIQIGAALTSIAVALPILTRLIGIITTLATVFATFKAVAILGMADISKGGISLNTTFGKIYQSIKNWLQLTPRFAELGGRLGSIGKLVGELGTRLSFIPTALTAILTGFLRIIPVVGLVTAAVYALNEAFKIATGEGLAANLENLVTKYFPNLAKKINQLGENLGMAPAPSQLKAMEKVNQEMHDNEMARILARSEARKKELGIGINRKVIGAGDQEIARMNQQLKMQSETLQINLQTVRDRLSTEAAIIKLQGTKNKLSEDELVIREALREVDLEQINAIRNITNEIQKLNLEIKMGSEDSTLPARIRLLEEQKNKINEIYNIHKQELPAHIQNLRNQQLLEQDRLRTLENITQEIEKQISRQQNLDSILQSANDKLRDVQFEGEQMRRSPLEQQIANIQEQARKAAMEAGRAFSQAFDEGDGLTAERAQELANGLDEIAQRYRKIAEEQIKQLDYSRSWEAGWKKAFDSYIENSTNAATRAAETFNVITRNMESAIDKFVETGKFSFRDFATSIIQELIKIELKSNAMKIWGIISGGGGGGGGLGSIFSNIFSFLGFANGGQPPMNKLSLVGEKGPELFMPKQPGTIIPNDQLGNMGRQEQVVNNYYTYNVNAIDSKSVAQFFAEHRRTMLGTIQLAQKEMPYSNV